MAQNVGRKARDRSVSVRGRAEVRGGPPRPAGTAKAPRRPDAASPPDRLTTLRRQAKDAGLSINSRPDPRGGDARRYSLVERATKAVVARGIPDLDTLATELTSRIRERTDQGRVVAHEDLGEKCPDCGTRRIGAFRYCRSCGRDFEPDAPTAQLPQVAAGQPLFSLQNVATTASRDQQPSRVEAAAVLSQDRVRAVMSQARLRRPDDPRTGDAPMTATRSDVGPRSASVGSTMRTVIVLGIGVGIGVGALVALVLSAVQR